MLFLGQEHVLNDPVALLQLAPNRTSLPRRDNDDKGEREFRLRQKTLDVRLHRFDERLSERWIGLERTRRGEELKETSTAAEAVVNIREGTAVSAVVCV